MSLPWIKKFYIIQACCQPNVLYNSSSQLADCQFNEVTWEVDSVDPERWPRIHTTSASTQPPHPHSLRSHTASAATQPPHPHSLRIHTASASTQPPHPHNLRIHTASASTQPPHPHSLRIHTASASTQPPQPHSLRIHAAVATSGSRPAISTFWVNSWL